MPDSQEMVKVAFRDSDGDVETLWATDLGGGRYKLENSPWYQYGVSWNDVVAARPEDDGFLHVSHILEKGGHRTMRVRSTVAVPTQLLDALVAHGCTYEGADSAFIAIDVPPGVDLDRAAKILVESGLEWEHADPTYEELYGAGA